MTILFVRGSATLPMYCSSQSMGAPAASKIFFTESAISGPIPSPGKSVQVIVSPLYNLDDVERYPELCPNATLLARNALLAARMARLIGANPKAAALLGGRARNVIALIDTPFSQHFFTPVAIAAVVNGLQGWWRRCKEKPTQSCLWKERQRTDVAHCRGSTPGSANSDLSC